MNRPPMTMRIRIKNPKTKINLWLPLFLIFPFMAIFLLVLAPLALLTAIILLPFGYARSVLCAPAILGIFHAMQGLEVDVAQNDKESVLITVK